jgi:hypothetical protein
VKSLICVSHRPGDKDATVSVQTTGSQIDLVVDDSENYEAAGLALTAAQARQVRDALDKALAEVDRLEPTDEQSEALGREIAEPLVRSIEGLRETGRAAWLRGARPTGLIGS